MNKRLLFLLSVALFAAGVFFVFPRAKLKPINNFFEIPERKIQINGFHSAFHMDKVFYGDLDKIIPSSFVDEKIYGGIVSHHLLVAKEIAKFFYQFKGQSPETIVIIGPNHFNVGKGDLLVSKYSYKTPWGIVHPAENSIDKLVDKKSVYNDETPFSREHSISALVGFIKYYFPDAKIVPIIIKRETRKERIDFLAQNLNEFLPDNAVVISSVDFSHHLDRTAARFHDQRSISAIKSFDYDRILGNEIDSPESIYALLKFLKLREGQKMVYENINSADFTGNFLSSDVTSYLFAHFIKGESQSDGKISLLSFGDMMLGRDVEKSIKSGLNPFEKIKGPEGNFLRGVDFISANLEGPITDHNDCANKKYSFKFNPEVTGLIAKHGINITNLANNHTGDCGEKGRLDTEKHLSDSGIDFFGNLFFEKSYIEKEINGQKIIFMGIDATIHSDNLTQYYELVKKLKEKSDYIAVNIHWGYEYHSRPSQIQKDIAYSLIDSGADTIIGHHPHVVQPVEIYKNKAIFYSLGNFIFDQIGEKTNEGLGAGTVFNKDGAEYFLFPYDIKNYQPILRTPEHTEFFCDQFLKEIKNRSRCYFEVKTN